MDITTARRELMRGSLGDSGAELIVDPDGVYIDVSAVEGDIIPLTADDIRELMVDLAVALRLAENA